MQTAVEGSRHSPLRFENRCDPTRPLYCRLSRFVRSGSFARKASAHPLHVAPAKQPVFSSAARFARPVRFVGARDLLFLLLPALFPYMDVPPTVDRLYAARFVVAGLQTGQRDVPGPHVALPFIPALFPRRVPQSSIVRVRAFCARRFLEGGFAPDLPHFSPLNSQPAPAARNKLAHGVSRGCPTSHPQAP